VGCTKNPRRAVETGPDGLGGDGVEIHGPASAAAVASMARVSEEPREGIDRVGFLHGADRDLSGPVRVRGAEPRPTAAGSLQRYGASDRGLDGATTARGGRGGQGAPVSRTRPRPGVWRAIFAPGQDIGHPRSGDCAPLAVAKRVCGAGDWLDSTGMPGPRGRDWRTASPSDPVDVRRLLQSDADTFIPD